MYRNNTKISITIKGDGSEIFDYSLPHPHKYIRNNGNDGIYTLEYVINGFFGTNKSYDFLNDIIARFTLSMNVLSTEISDSNDKGIELSCFQGLRSVKKFKYRETVEVNNDNVFWAIKFYTEHLIKEYNGLVPYSLIESFAFERFVERTKDKSTLRAKCRSIWSWYNERNWTIPKRAKLTKDELMATRSENAKKVAQLKVDKNYKKVVNTLTGLYAIEEYKKKSGAWHYGKLCEATGLSPNTVKKYVKKFENEQAANS